MNSSRDFKGIQELSQGLCDWCREKEMTTIDALVVLGNIMSYPLSDMVSNLDQQPDHEWQEFSDEMKNHFGHLIGMIMHLDSHANPERYEKMLAVMEEQNRAENFDTLLDKLFNPEEEDGS